MKSKAIMSLVEQAGHPKSIDEAIKRGVHIGEGLADVFGMKVLCLATAIREAQKRDCSSQYILCELLIDLLADKYGGRLDQQNG